MLASAFIQQQQQRPSEGGGVAVRCALAGVVRDLTARTNLQNDDPNHLGLRCNALPEHQMALITSGLCAFQEDSLFPELVQPNGLQQTLGG